MLKLRAVQLAISFLSLSLSHLDNRQTKIAENSAIHFFLKLTPKKKFVESFKFFDPHTTKSLSFKFFAKLNGNHILMANFSKFGKYQTFVLTDLHNLSKFQLADRIFKLWKGCVYEYLRIPTFKQLCQNFYEKISRFLNRLWKYW